MNEHKAFDILGNQIEVGDTVVAAVRDGNTPALRVGTVLEVIYVKTYKTWNPKTFQHDLDEDVFKFKVEVSGKTSRWRGHGACPANYKTTYNMADRIVVVKKGK